MSGIVRSGYGSGGEFGKLADFEIKHTFGVDPLPRYLIELPGGH